MNGAGSPRGAWSAHSAQLRTLGSQGAVGRQCLEDVRSTTRLITADARQSKWKRALDAFAELRLRVGGSAGDRCPTMLDAFAYGAALGACEKGKQPTLAMGLLSSMMDEVVEPSLICFNTVISAFAKRGWENALGLLGAVRCSGITPDVVSCSAAATACERGCWWPGAIGVLRDCTSCITVGQCTTGDAPRRKRLSAECLHVQRLNQRLREGQQPEGRAGCAARHGSQAPGAQRRGL